MSYESITPKQETAEDEPSTKQGQGQNKRAKSSTEVAPAPHIHLAPQSGIVHYAKTRSTNLKKTTLRTYLKSIKLQGKAKKSTNIMLHMEREVEIKQL